MNGSKFSIFLVGGLLVLLGVLAVLQYRWIGQISGAEQERLQKRLETDSQRFADDFNRELRDAYFTFQIDARDWRESDFSEFNERLAYWRSNTKFPALITDFYFVTGDEITHYNPATRSFAAAEWTDELRGISHDFSANNKFEAIDEKSLTLSLPIYDSPDRVFVRRPVPPDALPEQHLPPEIPKAFGYLIIKLDPQVVKAQIFTALTKQYFSGDSGAYNLTVTSKANKGDVIFSNVSGSADPTAAHDAELPVFNLAPGNYAVFLNQNVLSKIGNGKSIVLEEKIQSKQNVPATQSTDITINAQSGAGMRTRIFQGISSRVGDGLWILTVDHQDGSLEKFIANTRWRNLGISFGILGLLGVSIVFIFITSRRAQSLAQKQMDFVSAVSHEFRTPIAVIHSAGENLTDGVVNSREKVERYGNLIKVEGKKLSAMVEQILEFAGARSGRKKYDFRETDVGTIIEDALSECGPLLAEKHVVVDKFVADNLPGVTADAGALSHAVQNLVINAVKYGDDSNRLLISAEFDGAAVKIAVKDHGRGIAKSDIGKIFSPFYRARDVVDAQIHGNGLGLSLVKQTVDAHHGKIKVESEIGKGSTFTIQLPVERSAKSGNSVPFIL